jgi:hypothetical protein
MGEGQVQLRGPLPGGGHHEREVLVGDPSGPPAGPVRLRRAQALGVERMDHIPHGVRVGRHQPGDRRHRRPVSQDPD